MSKVNKPLKFVILGGGTAGWMAANLFLKKWSRDQVEVSLIESPDIGIIGVGEGSTPTLKRFFELVEIPEKDWMPRCNATYKLNIRFAGWSPSSGIDSYSHPFFSQIDTFTQRPFFVNCLTRRLGLDVNTTPEDFLLNGVLAKQKKGPMTPDRFPFRMEYGYHFDSGLLGEYLSEIASQRGVNHIREKVVDVKRSEIGDIKRLVCESGKEIDGDFFVDCSGFSAVLMQKTLGVSFDSFGDNLFNDRAVVMPTANDIENIPVETEAHALSSGWCWKIPLTNRFGNGYVYSSNFITEEDAEREFRTHIGMLDSGDECRHLKMNVGQVQEHWSHNCIGLGLSQGFIEPLEATALHLVQVTIELFISKFEEGGFTNKHQGEFNRKIKDRFDRVRDYIVAHYKLNTRNDSEYWKANRENLTLSESLKQLLDVWYRRGDLPGEIERQKIESHFGVLSWHCLLAGYGAFPPLAPSQPGKGDRYIEAGVADFLAGCALNYKSQTENLELLAK